MLLPVSNPFTALFTLLLAQAEVTLCSIDPNSSNNDTEYVDFSGNFSEADMTAIQALLNHSVVRYFLKLNLSTLPDDIRNRPIVYPVLMGQLDVVEMLLDHGADVETTCPTFENETIFFISCTLGHVNLVRLLYERGAKFTSVSYDEKLEPIHIAALGGHTAVVDFLLTKEPRLINATDQNGNLPIDWYFRGFPLNKEPGLLDVFLLHGTGVNSRSAGNNTLLTSAVLTGSLALVTKLVAKGANVKLTSKGSMPIHKAASLGQLPIVRYFLEEDPSLLNAADKDQGTPMFRAVLRGQFAVVDYFLRLGCNIEQHFDKYAGSTVLHVASLVSSLSMVRLLVSWGANLTSRDWNGLVPLHRAATSNKVAIIDFYLDSGVNIDIIDNIGHTPFSWACTMGRVEAAKQLIVRGADLDTHDVYEMFPIHIAASGGFIEIVNAIANARPYMVYLPFAVNGFLPIHVAITAGQLEMVRFFIEVLNVSVETRTTDEFGDTCLMVAVPGRNPVTNLLRLNVNAFPPRLTAVKVLEVIKFLVSKGANITAKSLTNGFMPIHRAAASGSVEVVEYFLDLQAELIGALSHLCRPIHVAAMTSEVDVIDLLLKRGEQVDTRCNCSGFELATPLHMAIIANQLYAVKFLVSKGANFSLPYSLKGRMYNHSLYSASSTGQLPVIRYLASLEPRLLYDKEEYQQMPIHVAAMTGQVAVVDYFLKMNVSVNVQTVFGQTPLHFACGYQNNLAVVKLLISKGANLSLATVEHHFENLPIHYAARSGVLPLLKYLLSLDGSLNKTENNRGAFRFT